jgi:S-adenosyl-L-methionine hydrolase (adenosine-forming)
VTIITLLTDFGLRDGYPGVMKGVIYQIAPGVQIVDISHLIQPQNIREGSLLLKRSYPFFPEGTIHVVIVDPGVGTDRRPIAARLGKQYYVCPDNGLITSPLVEAENENLPVEIVHLDRKEFWLPEVSYVFHGRDIFSPVAAHLARGVALGELGSSISDPVRLIPSQPSPISNGWRGEITAVDHFGNLSTNFSPYHLAGLQNPHVRLAGQTITGLVRTFGEKPPGSLVAFIDSDGFMAVAVVNGSAAQALGAETGAPVEVTELT